MGKEITEEGAMLIRMKESRTLQCGALAVLLVRTTVTMSVFASLQMLSYAFLGMSMLLFLMMAVFSLEKPRMTAFGLLVSLYFLFLITLSLLNATDLVHAVLFGSEVGLLLMIFYYFRDRLRLTLYTCAIVFSLIIYGNLLYMLLFPDWLYETKDSFYGYLLGGNYNQMGGRVLCGLATNVLCVRLNRKWLLNVVPLFLVTIFTMLLVGSMTSFVCITLYALLCLLPWMWLRKTAAVALLVVYLLFQVFVVFAGEGLYNNELIAYFVEQVLGKNLTFTYRTVMWASAGEAFSASPLWGYGEVDTEWYLSNMSSRAIGPHNFVYAVLLRGGVLLIILLIAIFLTACKRLLSTPLTPSAMRLLMAVEVWLVMGLMEVYPVFYIMYLLTLTYYYPDIHALGQGKGTTPSLGPASEGEP